MLAPLPTVVVEQHSRTGSPMPSPWWTSRCRRRIPAMKPARTGKEGEGLRVRSQSHGPPHRRCRTRAYMSSSIGPGSASAAPAGACGAASAGCAAAGAPSARRSADRAAGPRSSAARAAAASSPAARRALDSSGLSMIRSGSQREIRSTQADP